MPSNVDISKLVEIAKGIGAARLEAACVFLVNKIRDNLSVPGRTQTQGMIKRGPHKGEAKTVWGPIGSKPSQPGGFPAKQTGTLRSTIAYDVDKDNLTAKVGTSSRVGYWLEFGTRGGTIITPQEKRVLANQALGQIFGTKVRQGAIEARPWLVKTVQQNQSEVNQILAGKSPG